MNIQIKGDNDFPGKCYYCCSGFWILLNATVLWWL